MEIWASKLENAKSMWEMSDGSSPWFSRKFVFKKIFRMSDDDIQRNEQDVIEDAKQLWRIKQIAEEGNDPAKPFKKINPNVGAGVGEKSGGLPSGGGIGGSELKGPEGEEGGRPEAGGPEVGGGKEGPEAGPVKEETVIEKPFIQYRKRANWEWTKTDKEKEEEMDELEEKHGEPGPNYVRPSQAGEKDASKYIRGEDPIGNKENERNSKVDMELTTRKRIESPFALEMKSVIKNLDTYLSSSKQEKKQLVKESTGKSILDETNILE
jgi:hypothetical protein